MRILPGAAAALLLLILSLIGPVSPARATGCVQDVGVSTDDTIRTDSRLDAGAFIKPEVAPRTLGERSEEAPKELEGADESVRRGSCPFSPDSFLSAQPAPSSARVRRALLHVYRL